MASLVPHNAVEVGLLDCDRTQMTGDNSITLNNRDTVKFIQLYQQQDLLWNVNLRDHKNKEKRSECLKRISYLMGNNWNERQVQDKIFSLRSRYSKEIVKVRVSIATGVDHYTPVWRFFSMLDSFLRPFCVTRKTDTPVVRAFHKRLIEGRCHSSGSGLLVAHTSQQEAAKLLHSISSPGNLNGSYYGYHKNVSLSVNECEDNNDDDVQIIEDNHMGGGLQDETWYIDGDDENETISSKNAEGNEDENFTASENQGDFIAHEEYFHGHHTHINDNQGRQVVVPNSDNQPCELNPTPLEPLPVEMDGDYENGNCSNFSTNVIDSGATCNSGTLSGHGSLSLDANHQENTDQEDLSLNQVQVKQKQKLPTPPTPPPPLLPRQCIHSADEENNLVQLTSETGPTKTSNHEQENGDQSIDYDLENIIFGQENWLPEAGSSFSGEPINKKVKLEKSPVGQSHGKSVKKSHVKTVDTGHLNVSYTVESNSSCSQTNKLNTNQLNNELSNATLSQVENELKNITSQLGNQMTSVMTGQLTNLLETLITNLAKKLSPSVTTDSDLAFVNYMVCELRKLDEDLCEDVKFNIQKHIYEAQKEMKHRQIIKNDCAALEH